MCNIERKGEFSEIGNAGKLSATLRSIGDAVIATDTKGYITLMNPVAEALTGWKLKDGKGRLLEDIFKIINSKTRKIVENPVKKVLSTGKIVGLANHTILISKDGTEYQIADSASPIKNNQDIILGVVLVFRDVTEKYRMQEQIKEKEQTFSVLLSNLPGMAYKCENDDDWTMRFVSEGCQELIGYKSEELINNKIVSYGDLIDSNFKEYVWNKVQNSLRKEGSFKIEYIVNTKNNEKKWVWEQGRGVFNARGKLVNIQGFITDITERKRREKEIKYLGFHDNLTDLYNRAFFEEKIKRFNRGEKLPVGLIMVDINGLKLINDSFGHKSGDRVLVKTAENLKKVVRKEDILARYGGDEFVVLMPAADEVEVQNILKKIKTRFAEIQRGTNEDEIPFSISQGFAVNSDPSEDIYMTVKRAEDRMYRNKLLESQSAKSHIVNTLLNTLREKSQETEEHALRMKKLSLELGEKIGLSDYEKDKLSLLAALHDIGKTIIPEGILTKPGKLTNEEWAEIIKHPGTGFRICSGTEDFSHIADDILFHHERWDGTGYPKGLKGKNIPLLARIISIVDAYDVMTNGRPYKEPITMKEALEELRKCAGSQFDPELVEVFKEILSEF